MGNVAVAWRQRKSLLSGPFCGLIISESRCADTSDGVRLEWTEGQVTFYLSVKSVRTFFFYTFYSFFIKVTFYLTSVVPSVPTGLLSMEADGATVSAPFYGYSNL